MHAQSGSVNIVATVLDDTRQKSTCAQRSSVALKSMLLIGHKDGQVISILMTTHVLYPAATSAHEHAHL